MMFMASHIAPERPRVLASSRPRVLASSRPRVLASSRPRVLASSRPRVLASIHLYIGAIKQLIFSMKRLKPAIATTACAGIRRMEASQPPALGMRTFGGKGAGQWQRLWALLTRSIRFVIHLPQGHKTSNRAAV